MCLSKKTPKILSITTRLVAKFAKRGKKIAKRGKKIARRVVSRHFIDDM